MTATKAAPTVLQTTPLPTETDALLRAHFPVLTLPEGDRDAFLQEHGREICAIAGTGKGRVDTAALDALPRLEFISAYSAGLDDIDVAACQARGVKIANTSHILADDVADTALALLLSAARGICRADRFVRAGSWGDDQFPLTRSMTGLKVGIVGLGHIGKATATRLKAVNARVAYHGPREKPESGLPYRARLADLADWADALVIACPFNPETRGLIDAGILAALGPDGFLVNIARGSIVDEDALIAALAQDAIAGAGLDVFTQEPVVPLALRRDERVTLLPHIASGSVQTRRRMGEAMVAALTGHFGLAQPAAED